MPMRNTAQRYGLVSVCLHWLMALGVFALIALGLWMTDLTYYSPYYTSAPFWHKSVGLFLAALLVLRLGWRLINSKPEAVPGHKRWEITLSALVHALLYLLLGIIVISGYLISTAKGQGINLFGWFEVPALVTGLPQQADRAGAVHYWVAMGVLGLVALHALGALKHHLLDRDDTLRRMLGMRLTNAKES